MSESRPAIPDPMKRSVRQRCGFGCVVCGVPIYQYEHMEEYSVVKEHKEDNIILLCPNHHQDKTSGRLSIDEVKKHAENPRNKKTDHTSPYNRLFVSGPRVEFFVSNTKYISTIEDGGSFDAIRIFGKTVVGCKRENDNILLNIVMTDHSGEFVLEVSNGEIIVSTGVWDYTLEGKEIIIRSGPGQIEFKMSIDGSVVTIEKGTFFVPPVKLFIESKGHTIWRNGQISPQQGFVMINCSVTDCKGGLVIGN
jgi:hypothetical protein